ncbi:intermembrane space protein [Aspergillus campestris IBT 28561]|uniref:Mitochondrial intermembrane space import and assembly protein 40 n=1 Tax=Aspergillus campestris (strain IBT 28561) TaxID=1392248 RepID=A0A2I1D581_ASPC2|nr:intermembrane space protein [Aspergillus campestris IBT 28561]PKY05029.1 intermembrane space protein [Aspergillus campestris IBT 28561]
MFRPASRALLRAPTVAVRGPATKRLISTGPAETKSRSWKNTAVRLGLAVGAVYYYNTSSVFADQPSFSFHRQPQADSEPSSPPTLDSITPRIREERQQQKPARAPADGSNAVKSAEELEEEAGQEAAFNPETGEINWDCPCLGGMAHGPCGEEFKAAFSCFVYSQEDPKGIECIDKFKGMQDCFRAHPDVYGAELEDDDEAPQAQAEAETEAEAPAASASAAAIEAPITANEIEAASAPEEKRTQAREVLSQVKTDAAVQGELAESDDLMPKAWHDTESKNDNPPEK